MSATFSNWLLTFSERQNIEKPHWPVKSFPKNGNFQKFMIPAF